ncbi:MAG: Clp protease N-terminal domain-containing protein [Egibacteraceae bacterium]
MFERFTDAARLVVVKAQEEARLLAHDAIGPEHLLLGLLVDGERAASQALVSFTSLEAVRSHIEEMLGRGEDPPAGHIPFTTPAKHALEGAFREAQGLGHEHIGTEHLLLGLLRDEDSRACGALQALGVDLGAVRERAVAVAGEEAPASGLRSWGGLDPMSERVERARARAQAERDPVHESDPGGWEFLAWAGTATLRAVAAARRHAGDTLRGEIARIDLVVGVLAVGDPEVGAALAEAGAENPSPGRLVPGYREGVSGGDAVVTLSGEARRVCSMAARLVPEEGAGIRPVHLLLAALEVLGPVRAAAVAERLGAEDVALRPALLRHAVGSPGSPASPGSDPSAP